MFLLSLSLFLLSPFLLSVTLTHSYYLTEFETVGTGTVKKMMVPISYVYYVQMIHKENSSCDTNLFWNGGIMTQACLKIG